MPFKISSAKWQPFCPGRDELMELVPGPLTYGTWNSLYKGFMGPSSKTSINHISHTGKNNQLGHNFVHVATAQLSWYAQNTHFPRTKWPPFANIFKYILMNENFCVMIRISLRFVINCPIDNKPTLVQVLAGRRTSDKPLPEPMINKFTDAYMQHYGEVN